MPMIDFYATEGAFRNPHALAQKLAGALMHWRECPTFPRFRTNTAAFIHDLPARATGT